MGAQTAISPAPVALGRDDSVMIFRSRLLTTESDGCELRTIFDRMASRNPMIANKVVAAGSLGEVMYSRAVASLETYRDTGVAVAPLAM